MTTDYIQAPAYSKGSGRKINKIVIHHWGVDGQTHDGVVRFFQGNPGTSAHYVVSAGRVTQMVSENDVAYHAGDWTANTESIGIECRPEKSPEDFNEVAQLVAAIWERHGELPLYPHKRFTATDCPGRWEAELGRLAAAARAIRNGKPAATGKPAASVPADVAVDGYWGAETTRAIQWINGTPVDGVVSSQSAHWQAKMPYLTGGWEWLPDSQAVGSQIIAKLQAAWGAKADGLYGAGTAEAMRRYYHAPAVGVETVKAFQRAINRSLQARRKP